MSKENPDKSNLSIKIDDLNRFFELSAIFSVIMCLIYIIFYLSLIFLHWNVITVFFSYFASNGKISAVFSNSISSISNYPAITNISIFIVIGIAFFYTLLSIKERGYLFYESEKFEGKNFKALLLVAGIVVSQFFLPFVYFLFTTSKILELIIILIFMALNFIAVFLLGSYFTILQDYERISNFKLSFKKIDVSKHFAFMYKNIIPNSMILLMFLVFFGLLASFNFLSILFIEFSLLIQYFIFCSITRNTEGPVNIFLKGSCTIFNNVYIAENSSSGYVIITLKNEKQKKIMTSSILYMELVELEEKEIESRKS